MLAEKHVPIADCGDPGNCLLEFLTRTVIELIIQAAAKQRKNRMTGHLHFKMGLYFRAELHAAPLFCLDGETL